jgi:predicted ATPase
VLCPLVVGREEELAALEQALGEARAGRGGVVPQLGEAGIGKSRLARETAAAAGQGTRVLAGRASRGGPVAFRPALSRLLPEWPGGPVARGLLTDVDDSLVVLAEAEPLLCLGTVRSEEASAGLELARGLRARRAARVLELPRLSGPAAARMVAACLPSRSEALGEAVARLAEGVPFPVEELLAAALVTGWAADRPGGPPLPPTFVDTVARRSQALGEHARLPLAAAAVLGRVFEWRLLPEITGLDEDVVLAALEQDLAGFAA